MEKGAPHGAHLNRHIFEVGEMFRQSQAAAAQDVDNVLPQGLPLNPLNFRKFSGRRQKSSAFFNDGSPHRPALRRRLPRPYIAEYVRRTCNTAAPFAVAGHC